MSFPPATEMFQFAGFASRGYGFTARYRRSGGFPHSDIFGSKLAPSSPKLFAGCNVLHRLYTPRHPPNALLTLEPPCTVNNPPAVGLTFKAPRSSSNTPLPGKRKQRPDRRPPNHQATKTSRPPCKANSTLSAKTPAHRIPLPAKPRSMGSMIQTDPKRSRYYAYASLTLTSPVTGNGTKPLPATTGRKSIPSQRCQRPPAAKPIRSTGPDLGAKAIVIRKTGQQAVSYQPSAISLICRLLGPAATGRRSRKRLTNNTDRRWRWWR